jgi:hypothetical protein
MARFQVSSAALALYCYRIHSIMAPTRVSAHRIGALLFCPACGTLLDLPRDDQDQIPCAQCGRLEPASCESTAACPSRLPPECVSLTFIAYENLPTKTYSSPNAFPSSLRSKRALVQNNVDEGEEAKDKDPVVSDPPLFEAKR